MKEQLEAAIDFLRETSSQNNRKHRQVREWGEANFGAPASEAVFDARLIKHNRQIGNRLQESLGKSPEIAYEIFVRDEDATMDKLVESYDQWQGNQPHRLVVFWDANRPVHVIVYEEDAVSEFFRREYPLATFEERARRTASTVVTPTITGARPTTMVVSDRVRRMVELGISTARAVLLVGPPGTGKTTLVQETSDAAADNPATFGFTTDVLKPLVVTPEESWTTRELVGGDTITDDGMLVFQPGVLLEAIRHNQWLVLDEANRADLDRIFGSALTWLAANPGDEVYVGRVSNVPNAGGVYLSWSQDAQSTVENFEALSDRENLDDVHFRAGRDWRLLGTYNALDAQRVFRFGQALGRRFLRVPIPPIAPGEFASLVAAAIPSATTAAADLVTKAYREHAATTETTLGPALFLRMAEYLEAGEQLHGESALAQLFAEAYVVNVGPWLAVLDPVVATQLGTALVTASVVDEDGWAWIQAMASHVG